MMFISVFNDVIGPVMRGPSSSHTAGSFHIGRVIRDLLGEKPAKIRIVFDPEGSYGRTYVQQGVDLAFVTGLMGWKQTDTVFKRAIEEAQKEGVQIEFILKKIPQADHPNYVILDVVGNFSASLLVEAKSVGGGIFEIVRINNYPILLDGKQYVTLIEAGTKKANQLAEHLRNHIPNADIKCIVQEQRNTLLTLTSNVPIENASLARYADDAVIRNAQPLYYTQKDKPAFFSAAEMVQFALDNSCSLGAAVLEYERKILGLTRRQAIDEMLSRYQVMKDSVALGLIDANVDMKLLRPVAGTIMKNIMAGKSAVGGLHSKASAAAMAVMHTCNSQGVVCAAPTGGAAGTLPGILTALDEEYCIEPEKMAHMLFAAGGIGLILAIRATFAAEVAGCQVEIGAAGAMGAAAVVEFAGGRADQACNAAAISFQNTMGSVCDPVQGMCEIPCHTRNGVAASSAFTNADMILSGYINPIQLDETIDAVYDSGRMLPGELRCTAKGGLAIAPSALRLQR